jgi:hypothetical protein
MISKSKMGATVVAALMALAIVAPANAQSATYTGLVEWLEVWTNGNVAFRLAGVTATCTSHQTFVLNKSASGTTNQYAALLAAKHAGKPIRIHSSGCAPAENYGNSYVQVDYLYVQD